MPCFPLSWHNSHCLLQSSPAIWEFYISILLVFTATVHVLSQYELSLGIGAAKTSKEKEAPQLKPHDESGRKYGEVNQRLAVRIKKGAGTRKQKWDWIEEKKRGSNSETNENDKRKWDLGFCRPAGSTQPRLRQILQTNTPLCQVDHYRGEKVTWWLWKRTEGPLKQYPDVVFIFYHFLSLMFFFLTQLFSQPHLQIWLQRM